MHVIKILFYHCIYNVVLGMLFSIIVDLDYDSFAFTSVLFTQ